MEQKNTGTRVVRFASWFYRKITHVPGLEGKVLTALDTGGFPALVELLTVYHLDGPEGYEKYVSFMYSYPNLLPLPASEVARIRDTISTYTFDRIYGAWFPTIVQEDAHNSVIRSADRYIRALEQVLPISRG